MPPPRMGSEEEVVVFAQLFGDGLEHRVRVSKWPGGMLAQSGIWEIWGENPAGKMRPVFEDRMEAARLKLADIDGSGLTDLVYIHSDHVAIYFNRGGNRLSDPIQIPLPEHFDSLDQIQFGDLLGDGTTCMLLSSTSPEIPASIL